MSVATPVRAVPAVSVTVLGGFGVRAGDEAVAVAPSAQRVVALLALHQRPLQRIYVASTLWIDSSEAHATASLRTALWRVRLPHGSLVQATGRTLALAPAVHVDLWELSASARDAVHGQDLPSPAQIDALCDAAEVLPDFYDDWAIIAREQFRHARLHALEELCERLAAAERFAEATSTGLAAVAAEPLRESAHRTLIRAHLAEGNVSEALRQFQLYRGLLRRELGLEPSPAIRRLVERCASRDAAVT